jgi:hypothetical protein
MRIRFAILLGALALWLFAAATAQAARSEFFGITHGPPLDAQDLQGMKDARIRTDRFLLLWPDVQPSEGSFDWSKYDSVVGGLASHGIRPLPFLYGSPAWVGDGNLFRPPIDSAADEQAWQDFVEAAVARYGPGGSYWANGGKYDQGFGTSAPTLPIQSWQIWNEPNLKRWFAPAPSSSQYGRLLRISHDAIKSQNPSAQIVLAGLFSEGDVKAWTYLGNLYGVSGVKNDFDVAALHPYGCTLDQTREGIQQVRDAMTSHGDGTTPLWFTEFAWGSGPPSSDPRFCKDKGPTGQRNLLSSSYKLILNNRKSWNVQRLYWFLWRDPAPESAFASSCSLCDDGGLLRYDRTPKPSYDTFTGFTAETTPPVASITGGPGQGSFTKDSTPTFSFASNEAGSTFACRIDTSYFTTCSSPYTRGSPLANGSHSFAVKAIDAPGNESAIVTRSFTVDTVPPQTTITSGPSGSTADRTPTFKFSSSESGSTFRCRFDSHAFGACSGPGAGHTPSSPLSTGSHSFEVRATDKANNTDPTPAKRTFTITGP